MYLDRRKKALCALVITVAAFTGLLCVLFYRGARGFPHPLLSLPAVQARPFPPEHLRPPVPRLLAAQISVLNAQTYEEAEARILDLKAAGVNTLIVRAFQNPGDRFFGFVLPRYPTGVYFQTSHALVVDPMLARITRIGHDCGLSVYAWMETRNMPLNISDPQRSKARRYDFDTGTLEPTHMWSIFDERIEKRLHGLFMDVACTGIDGILFQDDLVMYQHEDFSAKAVALFEKETGRDLDPEELYKKTFLSAQGRWLVSQYSDTFWLWARWKNEKLLALAGRLIAAAKQVSPEIAVAMNFVYESVSQPKNALAWLSQSLAAARGLPIDYFSIMAYHRQMRKELQLSEEATYESISHITSSLLKSIDEPYRILMKVQMSDWETGQGIPSLEAHEIFQRISDQGRVSLAFFPYSPQIPAHVIGCYFR
jgi:biofilm PGA synthesis lipoprotein PgaB